MSDPVLILGGTGGIGSALARRCRERGRPVHITGRDGGRLAALAQSLDAGASQVDVGDAEQIEQAVEAAAPDGRLGGLAYCVGSIDLVPLRRATAAQLAQSYALNVIGAALAVQAAAAALKAAEGAVVLFSSVAVQRGFANHSVIAAAKGGVEGLTRALAAELAPAVRVNCVAPSLTRTPLAEGLLANKAMAEGISAAHALGRLGEPDDVAALAVFLLGHEAAWMTGQIVGVDGGRMAVAR
ncbi:MAG: SDR family oxidoreductase [Kiloniellales bacterium]|nr:SDR family oxidoreductase [Kiloniellales bacterium]